MKPAPNLCECGHFLAALMHSMRCQGSLWIERGYICGLFAPVDHPQLDESIIIALNIDCTPEFNLLEIRHALGITMQRTLPSEN